MARVSLLHCMHARIRIFRCGQRLKIAETEAGDQSNVAIDQQLSFDPAIAARLSGVACAKQQERSGLPAFIQAGEPAAGEEAHFPEAVCWKSCVRSGALVVYR